MLTTTLFVDFGDGFAGGKLTMGANELVNTLAGPNLGLGTDILQFESLRSYMAKQSVDYNGTGGKGDAADYTALRNSVLDIVKRQFEPFDVIVKEAKATSVLDVVNAFNINNSDPTGENDAYVFVANMVDLAFNASLGELFGFLGVASGIDLANGANDTDETVLVAADICVQAAVFTPASLDVVIAGTVSHEAGHSFGLRHSEDGWDFTPDGQIGSDGDIDQMDSSDIMREGGAPVDLTLNYIAFFTRFSLQEGDRPAFMDLFDSWDPFARNNYYDILVSDPDIGPNPNGLAYVTGTGAFDDIVITRIDDTTAFVSVTPHRGPTFTPASMITFAPFTYAIDYTNGILIDGGVNDDRITIDATLGVEVRVRGGQGRNELRVLSNGVSDAAFTPSSDPVYVGGLPTSLDATVVLSGLGFSDTTIDISEFGTDSTVVFDGFINLTYLPPADGRTDIRLNGGAIDGRIGGPNGLIDTMVMRFINVANVLIDTSFVDPADNVDTNDILRIEGSAFSVPGLQNFEFRSGRGNDTLIVATPVFTLPVPGGAFIYDAGNGQDTIGTDADADFTLTDATLTSTGSSVVELFNLLGEFADLTGGDGDNTFLVENWAGIGTVNGLGGDDIFTFGTAGDIDTFIGEFTVIGGGGDDTLNLDHSSSDVAVNYNIGKTRIINDATTPAPFGRVNWEGTLDNLVLTGTKGKNVFFVTPGENLTIKIDGREPPDGTPPLDGDALSIFFSDAENRKLLRRGTGAGIWTFTSGEQPIIFEDIEFMGSLVAAAAKAGDGRPLVKVYNSLTNQLVFKFYAFESGFKGGVQTTMADVTGDGILDVIVASGAGRMGEVKVYDSVLLQALANTQKFVSLPAFAQVGETIRPEGTSYRSGYQVAAGDVNGDGDIEVITSRLTGTGKVRIFAKDVADVFSRMQTITPYSKSEGVTKGAVIAAGDVDGDGRDEIITAPGSGASAIIKVWEGESGSRSRTFLGFESSFKNGVSLAVGNGIGDGRDEIFVAAGSGGGSRVRVFNQFGNKQAEFKAYTSGNINAPVQLAARSSHPSDKVALYLAQGNDGRTSRIRVLDPLTGATVDSFLETDPDFRGGISMG
jgi:hypothetical protein